MLLNPTRLVPLASIEVDLIAPDLGFVRSGQRVVIAELFTNNEKNIIYFCVSFFART